MIKNIIIAGVGGQGILTISTIIDYAAMKEGLKIKQAEVHGMSQRGGAVQSHLRISDLEIFSDLIPYGQADMIISMEPVETLRYLPFLSSKGIIISALEPFVNISDYPQIELIKSEILKSSKAVLADAAKIAKELGNSKLVNTILTGIASRYIPIKKESFEEAIKNIFQKKGEEIVTLNLKAFNRGIEINE